MLAAGLLTRFSFPLERKFHEGKDLVCVVQWVLWVFLSPTHWAPCQVRGKTR